MPEKNIEDWTVEDAITEAIRFCYEKLRPSDHPNIRVRFRGRLRQEFEDSPFVFEGPNGDWTVEVAVNGTDGPDFEPIPDGFLIRRMTAYHIEDIVQDAFNWWTEYNYQEPEREPGDDFGW